MIQIDLKLFDKQEDLNLVEFLILTVLNEEPERLFYIDGNVLSNLEQSGYIRIIHGVCVMDSKSIALFESNPLVKKAKEILNHMNELKKSISPRPFTYATHGREIIARLNDGYDMELIKNVVTFMYQKWMGTEMQEYLRPSTLFNRTKFANYVETFEQNKNKVEIKQSRMDDE